MSHFAFTPGVVASLCVGVPGTLASAATLVQAVKNGRKTDAVHELANGRTTVLENQLRQEREENARLQAALRNRRHTDTDQGPHDEP